jgi:hypothetical protein
MIHWPAATAQFRAVGLAMAKLKGVLDAGAAGKQSLGSKQGSLAGGMKWHLRYKQRGFLLLQARLS